MAVERSLGPARAGNGLAVTITPAARQLRRRVGPVAWVALEELLAGTELVDGAHVASMSARRLGGLLGVGKDAAAAALRRLASAGLVERVPPARRDAGTFGDGAYLVQVAALEDVILEVQLRPATELASRRRRRVEVEQPALFDLANGDGA